MHLKFLELLTFIPAALPFFVHSFYRVLVRHMLRTTRIYLNYLASPRYVGPTLAYRCFFKSYIDLFL